MTRICKAALCVLLAWVMVFGAAGTAFAASPQFIILDPPSEEHHTFATDKDSYAWGDTITVMVEVTNVSENVLYNVRVSPHPRHPQWFTVVTNEEDCVIGTLQPEETAQVQIVLETQPLSLRDRISVLIAILRDKLLDGFADMYSSMLKVNYPVTRYNTVRVGSFDQGINFDVYYTNVQPEPTTETVVIF